jgi:hypothetical protein
MLESERTPPPSRDSYETSALRHYPKGRGGVALVLMTVRSEATQKGARPMLGIAPRGIWHINPLMWPVRKFGPSLGVLYQRGFTMCMARAPYKFYYDESFDLAQEGSYMPGGLILKGGLLC